MRLRAGKGQCPDTNDLGVQTGLGPSKPVLCSKTEGENHPEILKTTARRNHGTEDQRGHRERGSCGRAGADLGSHFRESGLYPQGHGYFKQESDNQLFLP